MIETFYAQIFSLFFTGQMSLNSFVKNIVEINFYRNVEILGKKKKRVFLPELKEAVMIQEQLFEVVVWNAGENNSTVEVKLARDR